MATRMRFSHGGESCATDSSGLVDISSSLHQPKSALASMRSIYRVGVSSRVRVYLPYKASANRAPQCTQISQFSLRLSAMAIHLLLSILRPAATVSSLSRTGIHQDWSDKKESRHLTHSASLLDVDALFLVSEVKRLFE